MFQIDAFTRPACVVPDDAEASWDRSFSHFARLVNEGKV